MIYAIDLTILNLAVPSLSSELQPRAAQLLWIVDAYGFLAAGSLLIMGTAPVETGNNPAPTRVYSSKSHWRARGISMMRRIPKYLVIGLVWNLWILSAGTANAGACAEKIAEFVTALPRDENGDATFVASAPQSIDAQARAPANADVGRTGKEARPIRNFRGFRPRGEARFGGKTTRMPRRDVQSKESTRFLESAGNRPQKVHSSLSIYHDQDGAFNIVC
jgi:hypothetical protein